MSGPVRLDLAVQPSEGIMITPDVARAHIDEMHRVAAQYQRAAGVPSLWRRLLTRHIRHS
ncbi:hypothetical protein ABZS29_25815 [Kribbella sp. NPDC005582]|uniref:hypothetical protein n=1 Tax=Kribbella sp. NPDC005582 TaxID=3156893 RepID=UPI0033BF7ACD